MPLKTIQRNSSLQQTSSDLIRTLRSIAISSLSRMYRPQERLFVYRLRKKGPVEVTEGISKRYTAISLIGLAHEEEYIVKQVLGSHSLEDICENLLSDIDQMQDLGEVALTTWAARTIKHPRASKSIERLRDFYAIGKRFPTIELSWALTALTIESAAVTDMALAREFAKVLMDSFQHKTAIFAHGPIRKGLKALCNHVSCFADFVYPIQALSYYYLATEDKRAAEIACLCAEHMCGLQGADGQWWWHFDSRTGRPLEYYPVYSVHQDSMAPMALIALSGTCGRDYSDYIEKGLRWLFQPVETKKSLIDTEKKIIWRSIARRQPGRLAIGLQSIASYIHPEIRFPGMNVFFPAVSIDYESRPYHMAWILHAWPLKREKRNFGSNIHTANFLVNNLK